MSSELDRLLQRSQKGDSDAWAALVGRLQSLVYSVANRYELGNDDAADVFMTTFGALHRNLDRIEAGRALPQWVAKTAARECLRLRRLRERISDVPLEEIVERDEFDAEKEAVRADDAQRVRAALSRMAPMCRDLLGMLYGDEPTSYAEAAHRLGVPLGTIGPMRARCLEKLRRTMQAEGFFE